MTNTHYGPSTGHPDQSSGPSRASEQVNADYAVWVAELATYQPPKSHGITCPTCSGAGAIAADLDYLEQFRARTLLQALEEATVVYWRRRAARLRDVIRRRPGDTYGTDTTPEELEARRRRIETKARAFEMKAAVLEGPDAVLALAQQFGLAGTPSHKVKDAA